MSKEQARSFLKRLTHDPHLAEEVRSAYARAVHEVAVSFGYDLTPEDLDQVATEDLSEEAPWGAAELAVEDLAQVTGGTGVPHELTTWLYTRAYSDYTITGNTSDEELTVIFQSLPAMLPTELQPAAQAIVDNIVRHSQFRPQKILPNTM